MQKKYQVKAENCDMLVKQACANLEKSLKAKSRVSAKVLEVEAA